jgi:diguanylate cyclase (GGDEF)-like protein
MSINILEYVKKLDIADEQKFCGSEEFQKEKGDASYWLKSMKLPILDENDELLGYAYTQIDITKYKKFEMLAVTDALTELYNRRFFNEVLTREIHRAQRDGSFLSFMMLDIDYFKKYNDSYGHDAGDKALVAVAQAIKKSVHRAGDYVFRLGGEEFGVLLSNTTKENSLYLAQNIRRNIEMLSIKHANSQVTDHITVSIGILVIDFEQEDVDENGFYTMSDDALYQAKEQGRNRVVLYENDELEFF